MKFKKHKASFRFYEELNDFLPESKKKVRFEHEFRDRASVKDMIEAIGVPHTEVDMILVNGEPVDFSYLVKDEDDISVYPVFESFDINEVQRLRPKPLREPKFVLDVHLGKLAKMMRMLGLDVYYKNDLSDEEIIEISLNERRAILTKDLGILKNGKVTHGYYVRNSDPEKQITEVVERFHLSHEVKELSRCLECNTQLEQIEKEMIIDRLPPKVKKHFNEFFICENCDKVYWKGSHYEDMARRVRGMIE